MGKMQRIKGRAFEQLIANLYRQRWEEATVRRSLQAHQPYEPDVVVEHELPHVSALWTECQHAVAPTPLAKLLQAERDVERAKTMGRHPAGQPPGAAHPWLPVAVWRRSGATAIHVTMRHWVFATLALGLRPCTHVDQVAITMEFRDFISSIRSS